MKRYFLARLIFSVFVFVLSFAFLPAGRQASAAINPQINYQGKLTNASSVAVADGSYSIVFSLYTAASGGTAIWTETQSVTVTSGLFSVMLGTTTSLANVNFNQTLYLGVNVAADGEMTPRKIIGAVPAAFLASAVSGSTTPSSFGTTTALANTQVTIEATTTTAIPLTLRASSGQTANLFQIQNSAASNLLYANASGGLFASSTLQVTGAATLYDNLTVSGSLLVNNATSTITNLTMINATSTNATTTTFAVFSAARFGGTATSTFNSLGDLLVVGSTTLQNFTGLNATTTNATTTTLYVSGSATSTFGGGLNLTTGNLNLPTGGSYLINNANILSATALGSTVTGSSLTSVGIITSGTWRGTAVAAQYGGTGQDFSASSGWLHVAAGTFSASTSPTVNWLTATSTTATSTFSTAGFTVGTSRLVVQQGSGNVGIGTTTPSDKLTLYNGSFRQAPGNPVQVGSLALGPDYTDVAIQGRYAYVVSITDDVLKVIDVSDPTKPIAVGTPVSLGSVSTTARLAVAGRYAYVIIGASSLVIVDISDPASLRVVSTLSIATTIADIAVAGRYAYLIDQSLSPGDNGNLTVVNVSDASAPVIVSVLQLNAAPGGVISSQDTHLQVIGRYAYIVIGTGDDLRIIDISNPASPTQVADLDFTQTTSDVGDLAVSGRYLYYTDASNSKLQIIDVATSTAPTEVSSVTLDGGVQGLAVAGRYGYVVSTLDTLKIVDLASSTASVVVGSASVTIADDVAVATAGRYAYVVNQNSSSGNLTVFDLSGLEAASGMIHSLEAGSLQVRESASVNQNLSVVGGINVGVGGIFSSGPLSVSVAATTTSGTASTSAYFQGSVGIATTSPLRTFDVVGTWGGNTVVDAGTYGTTQTVTKSTKALIYHLTNNINTDPGTSRTITYNITGLPNVEGTFAYIYTFAQKDATTAAITSTVTIQINGTQVSTVATANTASAAGPVYESYTIVYSNGAWHVIGTPGTSDLADLAEWIEYEGEPPAAGELLSLTSAPAKVVRTTVAYDPNLTGIVSTAPHTVMGKETASSTMLSLAGRVPVKVSAENGAIAIGDYLTSSSLPGVAMKATRPGRVVGRALEPYSGPDPGQILVLVEPADWPGPVLPAATSTPLETLFLTGSAPESESFIARFFDKLFDRIKQWFADAANGIAKLFVKEVRTEKLCLASGSGGEDVCLDRAGLQALLNREAAAPAPPPAPAEPPPAPVGEEATTTDEVVATTTEEIIIPDPITIEEPVEESAPEKEPAPEPVLEPTPEPVLSDNPLIP
ncbi:MAG: hypothetical protein HYT46_01665 [Candidatus Vogelbacteria bacterium]|nr:hypothetical protein [Candidatus Vogelbacteria bacterium]